MGVEKPNKPSWIFTSYYKCEGFDSQMRKMITDKFSKTTSLLLIATFALAWRPQFLLLDVGAMDADTGFPAFLSEV